MRVFQEGKKGIWTYEFEFKGIRHRKSTKTKDRKDAVTIMNKRYQELVLGHNNIEVKKPTKLFRVAVKEYMDDRIMLDEHHPFH